MKPIQSIPKHLKRFTLKQNYKLYTPIDQAGWRFIMQISKDFFKDHAHIKYLGGLPATGISTEEIPRIEVMDKCLKKLGWRAAVVSGFIPPAVFLEFLSLGILPIACDMRTLGHLHYTPAPDIVHEAAGHAPILADPEYANYIRKYGEISQKVIFSAEDLDVYNAIRKLSDIKEDPHSTEDDIHQANQELDEAVAKNTMVSEATQLSRMAWWTIEYGLVGSLDKPLIYGAGLLSSLGESYDCFVKKVAKVPLTLDCINVSYDITKPQPQLFVTPNFQHLVDVLEEFSLTMAYRIGAEKGLQKALEARTITTTQWSNDAQVSGILEKVSLDSWSRPSLIQWKGHCQISWQHQEIKGFGPKRFSKGICAVTGPLVPSSALAFKKLKLDKKPRVDLMFESGIDLKGKVSQVLRKGKTPLALIFESAEVGGVKYSDVVMILSDKVNSVFGEAADRGAFYDYVPFIHEPNSQQKTTLTKDNTRLNKLYQEVRDIRSKKMGSTQLARLKSIHEELISNFPTDWLLRLEILELLSKTQDSQSVAKIQNELRVIQTKVPDQKDLIDRGLKVLV